MGTARLEQPTAHVADERDGPPCLPRTQECQGRDLLSPNERCVRSPTHRSQRLAEGPHGARERRVSPTRKKASLSRPQRRSFPPVDRRTTTPDSSWTFALAPACTPTGRRASPASRGGTLAFMIQAAGADACLQRARRVYARPVGCSRRAAGADRRRRIATSVACALGALSATSRRNDWRCSSIV